jgi:hypothetical protein
MEGEAVNRSESKSCPPFSSYEDLKQFNKRNAPLITELQNKDKVIDRMTWMCRELIESSDPFQIRQIHLKKDVTTAFNWFLPEFREFFSSMRKYLEELVDFSSELEFALYALGLEMLLAAVVREEGRAVHPSIAGIHPGRYYDVYLAMYGAADRANEMLVAQELAKAEKHWEERKIQFQSIDEERENDPDLPPVQKARVLRNALKARNEAGYLYTWREGLVDEGGFRFDFSKHMIINQAGLDAAEQFFAEHRHITVADILGTIDACIEIHGTRPWCLDDETRFFYIKRAVILPFFFKHIRKIDEELQREVDASYLPLPV